MKRRRLFEFGDVAWLPKQFRNYLTDIFTFQAGIVYQHALPKLVETLKENKCFEILDLCSGSGGPWPVLLPIINKHAPKTVKVILSDKFPSSIYNKTESYTNITYYSSPIDALNIPAGIKTFRTMFNGFHHFNEGEAISVLEQTTDQNLPIAIFEFTERKSRRIKEILSSPGLVFKLIRQLPYQSKGLFFWTYCIPLVPLMYYWDAIVSQLRSYTPEELKTIANQAVTPNYLWECGQIDLPGTVNKITYLIGQPAINVGNSKSKQTRIMELH